MILQVVSTIFVPLPFHWYAHPKTPYENFCRLPIGVDHEMIVDNQVPVHPSLISAFQPVALPPIWSHNDHP